MAEKKVSVRLVAEGGRRVRAELEGVGEAGARGFGRLSREMELANTRLAAFARRAGLALGAAAAAATASLGLIVRFTAESAAQIRQFAQVANATPEALQRWSAGARTVGIEQEKLADILKDVNDRVGDFLQTGGGPMADFFENVAPRVGVTADQFARLSGPEALQLYVDTLERAGLSQQEMTFYLEAMASDATRMLPLLRNGGAEMARLGEQASDLGAVLDSDALEALRRTQLALGTVSLVFDGLRNRIAVAVAPTIEALANAFVALASDGGILRSAIDTLIGNLGRLASYAATFASVMAGRWVAGLAAAALSVRGLATALVFLRGALIRTGIGALIVGAGELVYQFSQLVARVGGVGEAFRLLGDLAREVWSRIGLSLDAALAQMAAGWEGLKAAGLSALEGTIAGVVSFGDRTAAIFQGAYDAAVAIWGSLPGAIGDFAFQAANGLISGVEAMLNGVVTRINSFIDTLNAALALLPEWATGEDGVRIGILDPVKLGRIGNPFEGAATAAGAAAADAFSAALARTYLEPPDLGLGAMADDARARADGYREAAGMLADAAGRALASWQALKDAVTGTGTEAETALADAAASADALTSGLNDTATAADGAGGAARNAGVAAAESADTALTGWQAVTAALADYAAKARDIGGDVGSALVGAFQSAENAIGEFVKTGKLDFRDLVTSMIADLAKLAAGTQTFTGNKTFSGTLTASGTFTVSAASASIGTATTTATYGMGTGATTTGVTKTVNIGTGGASGSTTVVNIGSASAGAGGTTVINTPTVTFANAVTQVGMPQANLTAQHLGLGGATADSFNRLSINTPAVLLNNAGAGIETTVNKAAAGNDAAFAFKTGFSARALIGLLGSDDFSFKVSPDGSAFFDAIRIDRTSGQVELPQPTVLPGLAAAPTPPPAGKAAVYARSRAGAPWIDVMRPSGRDFPLQPHFGVNRIATWSPSVTTTITTEGMPITSVGTVSHPTLAATNLAASMRRWRLTSAAVVDSVADQRSAGWACWRGNAAGLGGWTFVTRISLTTLQATGMGFFGLYGSTAALATTLTLAATINCIGIGFQRGTHTRWQLVTNDGTGAPTLTDMGASFGIATGGVLTLFIAAPPNGSSVWVRVVDEVSGAVFEQEITADLPAATQFLSPRLFLNTGATAAAVAYDCAGVYLETDF